MSSETNSGLTSEGNVPKKIRPFGPIIPLIPSNSSSIALIFGFLPLIDP